MSIRAFVLTTLLAACSGGPLSTPLPEDINSWGDDTAIREAVKELSEEDRKILMGFGARRILNESLGNPTDPMPATLGDALAAQRSFLAEQQRQQMEAEAFAAKQRAEADARMARLREVVTVAMVGKVFVEADWRRDIPRDVIGIQLDFRNNTDKPIAGVKGALTTQNMFGDTIKQITFAYDGGIPANGTASWTGTLDYNQFRDEDRNLANTPLDKIKVVWHPETILFADGSAL